MDEKARRNAHGPAKSRPVLHTQITGRHKRILKHGWLHAARYRKALQPPAAQGQCAAAAD
jgi:hypothetical protein